MDSQKGTALARCLILTLLGFALFLVGSQSSIEVKADAAIGNVPTGREPRTVVVNPITNKIYTANSIDGSVTEINGKDHSTIAIALGANPFSLGLNPTTNMIYAGTPGGLKVIDAVTRSVTTIPVGGGVTAIAVNPITNKIYVGEPLGSVIVVDGANNSTITVPVGSRPESIAVNPVTNKVYVANYHSSSVTVIDGASNMTQTLAVGSNPSSIAVNPVTNKIFVANSGSATLSIIDGSSGLTITVPTGTTPLDIAVNPATNKIYVANAGSSNATVLNGADNSTVSVPTGATPSAVALNIDTNKAYIVNNGNSSVTVIDGNNATSNLPTGSSPADVAVNNTTNKIYVSNSGASSVRVIDGADNRLTNVAVGTHPRYVAVNRSTGRAYVANLDGDSVTILSESGSTNTVSVGMGPNEVVVNSITNKAYVGNSRDSSVTVIDGSDNTTSILAGDGTKSLAINPVTDKVYVANIQSSSLTIINGVDNTTSTVSAGPSPVAVAVNAASNRVFVANRDSNTVTVLDGDGTLIASLPVGLSPCAVAVNAVTNKIYVANLGSGNVTIIDGNNNGTLTVSVGSSPRSIAVDQITNKIYVANSLSGSVSIINGINNSTATALVGSFPVAVAVDEARNKAFVANCGSTVNCSGGGSGSLSVIDGANNFPISLGVGTNPISVAINPKTGTAYLANYSSGNLSVVEPAIAVNNPLSTSVVPLPGNVTTNPVTTFTLTATSSYGPIAPPPQHILFQVDTRVNPFQFASEVSRTQTSLTAAATTSSLLPGLHTLYFFAVDGSEATSIVPGRPVISGLGKLNFGSASESSYVGGTGSYTFLVTGSSPTPTPSPTITPTPTPTVTPTPEISLEHPVGSSLSDGQSTVDFGTSLIGSPDTTRTFTIRNSGVGNLLVGAIAVSGSHPADFSINTSGMSSVVPTGGATTFRVTFVPGAAGAREAVLQLTTNDADENPFDVNLRGVGTASTPIPTPTPPGGPRPGDLDPSFGVKGHVLTPLGRSNDAINSVAVQSDGKIVGVGDQVPDSGIAQSVVLRYTPAGLLDPAFNSNGILILPVGRASSVAIQSDGKILIAGHHYEGVATQTDFYVYRLNGDGSVDPAFGTNGRIFLDFNFENDLCYTMVLQADGKILLGGQSDSPFSRKYFALTRLNEDGSPDMSFGNGGKVIHGPLTSETRIMDLKIRPDQKIVAAGRTESGVAALRYNSNGSLDTTFDLDGIAMTVGTALTVLNQPDDKIIAVGTAATQIPGGSFRDAFSLTRFNADGSLDLSFDGDGNVRTILNPNGGGDSSWDAMLQPDGKIVAVGRSGSSGGKVGIARYNPNGSLDTSFNGTGIVLQAIGTIEDSGYAVARLTTGEFLVAGSSFDPVTARDLLVARFSNEGLLDPSFGPPGFVSTAFGLSFDSASDVVAQPDGKSLAVGRVRNINSRYDFGISRYLVGGSLDTSFGGGGKVITSITTGDDEALRAAIQSDGKIVAAGYAGTSPNSDFAIVRYGVNGTLDSSFGSGGKVTIPVGTGMDVAYDVAIQVDGRIVVAGSTVRNSSTDFAVVRLNVNGSIDTSFGNNGIVLAHLAGEDIARSITLQSDSKIVVSGYTTIVGSDSDFAIVRYTTAGNLDPTFGSGGVVTSEVGNGDDRILAATVQSDDKILVTGSSSNGSDEDLALARYTTDGRLDTSFNGNGVATIAFWPNSNESGNAVVVQTDGKIVAAGTTVPGPNDSSIGLVRYYSDGTLDTTFGLNGFVVTDFGSRNELINGLAVQPDGGIVLAGGINVFTANHFLLLRYLSGGGSPTPTATPTNTPTATPTPTPVGYESDVAPRPDGDGSIVAGDVVQMRRFVAGLDAVNPATNEFQRTDTAPRATLGDGMINSTDVVQARRYGAGLDPLTNAGGPAVAADRPLRAFIGGSLFGAKVAEGDVDGSLRLSSGNGGALLVELESGREVAAVSFRVRYDAVLGKPRVSLGDLPDGAVLTVNDTARGELTILIDSVGSLGTAGRVLQLVEISFVQGSADGSVEFDGEPSVSDSFANDVRVTLRRSAGAYK